MKYRIIISIAFLLLVFTGINGQDIQLTVIATPPHPSLLSEFEEASENYRVNIVNLNQNKEHNIIIAGRLTSNNGIEVVLSENFNGYQILNIPAGSNQTLLFEELGGLLSDLTIDDIDYSGGPDIAYLAQSQRLPDGIYSICLEARDFDSRELLSLPYNANCSNPIIIQSVNPPTIITPIDEEVINTIDPTLINISWTPVMAPSASVVYDLRIAKYIELVNSYDAINDPNFIIYEIEDLLSNFFVYNQTHTPLELGEKYIVQVRARDQNNSVNIFNEGFSDITIFEFGGALIDPNDDVDNVPEGDFSCMSPCIAVDIPNLPSIPNIAIGDVFKIGHFNLQIDNFQQTASGYTGKGVIKASDFIPRDINVDFQDIQINERNIITNGAVNGARKAAMEAFPTLRDFSDNSDIDDILIDRIYDDLLDPAAAMVSDDLNESLDELSSALSLPISFGQGAYKIHIPDMNFTAEGASVTMLSGYEMKGDYLQGSEKLVFANPNICITPGGISSSGDIIKLGIINSQNFTPSEVFSIHVNGTEEDNGSYINIDCDGINEIVLNGHVEFNSDFLLGIENDGQINRNKKLAKAFHAQFTDWDEMIFTTHDEIEGTAENLFFTSSFEIQELPEFKFDFGTMIIDLSESIDYASMVFPEGANVNNWTGIFIENLSLGLPDYFEQEGANLRLDMSNLLIDNAGVSFDFEARNLDALTDISFGGWGTSIDLLRLQLSNNDLSEASLNGTMKLPICENPIGIFGNIAKIDGRLDYRLDMDIAEDWEVPMWACKFRCNNNSKVLAKIENGELELTANLSGKLELDDALGDWDKIKIKNISFQEMKISNVEPYFTTGDFDIDATFDAEFYGFNINIEDIGFSEINRPNINGGLPQLSFDLGFKFGEKGINNVGMYFSSDTRLHLLGKRNRNTGNYSFEGVELEQIEINSEVSTVKINGQLDIYNNHETYGDGIGGNLRVEFLDMNPSFDANVLFGNVTDYDYWYVDAGLMFDQGIELTPIQLLGISGGAFYNMRQERDLGASIGQKSSIYTPKKGAWGFNAGTVWATSGEANVMNGNVNLSVDFEPDGGLGPITLEGKAKMMDEPSFSSGEMTDTELLLAGSITYNHVEKSVEGAFGYRLDVPRGIGMLNGGQLDNSNISFNIASVDDWNFNLGEPSADGSLDDMMDFGLDLGFKIRGTQIGVKTSFSGYFNIGTNIPPMPPLPQKARSVVGPGFNFNSVRSSGIGTGLHFEFNTGKIAFGYDILGIEFRAGAGFGYDVSFMHKDGFLCNGDENFGINNWYLSGQAYIYASASLKAVLFGDRYNLASADIGAQLRVAGPNPLYAAGRLIIRPELPLIGRVSIGLGFSLGEVCDFEPIENQDEAFLNELAETVVLEELTDLPNGVIDFTDNDVKIIAQFFKRPNQAITEQFSDGSLVQYKVTHSITIREFVNGTWTLHTPTQEIETIPYYDGRMEVFLNRSTENQRLLSPGKNYKIEVKGVLRYRTSYSGPYLIAKDYNNENIIVDREFEFSTTELGDYEIDVLEISPKADMVNFHVGDAPANKGTINLSEGSISTMNNLGYGNHANLIFKFREYYKSIAIPTGNVFSTTGYMDNYNFGNLTFNVDQLRDGYNYKLDILLEYEDADPIVMYNQSFGTSIYHTLQEKLDHTSLDDISSYGSGANGGRYKLLFLNDEDVELPEEEMLLSFVPVGNTEWFQKRIAMEQFAQEHGFLNIIKYANLEFAPLISNGNSPISPLIVNFNYDPTNTQDPPMLKYIWKPNDYLVAIRAYAIQNHFGIIFGNSDLQELFFSPYEPLEEFGRYTFKLKSASQNAERTYQTTF